MIKKIHTLLIVFIVSLCALVSSVFLAPQVAYACDLVPGTGGITFEILTPWYKYLDGEEVTSTDSAGNERTNCRPTFTDDTIAETVTKVGIAVIELLTRLAALVALGFIIWGGIQYITSQGEPEGLSGAKNTITNAIIGLIIAIIAVGLVQFIGNAVS